MATRWQPPSYSHILCLPMFDHNVIDYVSCNKMRLFTQIKALGDATNRLPKTKGRDAKPKAKPRSRSDSLPVCNITQKEFSIATPSAGSIARRRSEKHVATVTTELMEDKHPLLHADSMEQTPDPSPTVTALTCCVRPTNQHNPYFPPLPQNRKRKRELDGFVKRVKSVKLSVNKKMLMELFDESQNDLRRFQIRGAAIEVEPLRDELDITSSADAIRRCDLVLQSRSNSVAFRTF
ncbi:hypothetical protein CB0940_07351 [Cercospora beticola]|uniref:Uncharacterized protein n=2 Tax=Cercospora beticola TaxID=122368 RepID=A0A2G5HAW1_CERBT|nr:hypothetical protein CB0940_07351 [Cercospora beticola]PIA89675.1 hypothetical protein CB0940_07351 [Cercospora beticola]